MSPSNAPTGASAETKQLVRQLTRLHDERQEVLALIRRGPNADDREAILFELCGIRGMQYTEAADALGVTREAVARKVRPRLDALGLAEMTAFERSMAEVPRPLRRFGSDELLAHLKAGTSPRNRSKRDLGAEARDLADRMTSTMSELHAAGMRWEEMAKATGISRSTLSRLRGVM